MATATKSKMKLHSTSIDIPQDVREQMIALLNQQLADTFDLYSQVKQAHWNVKGMDFMQLHEYFDELAEVIQEYVDEVAERATALGGIAMGTARMAASNSSLEEMNADLKTGEQFVRALVGRMADYAKSTREAIDTADEAGDISTSDLFTEISRAVDKHLWFLEAHIQ
ncbi:DNA starvation/stationary phase protection protein Dps [Phototrophicus methaneseepsis]|uniref:DNA starvation/stationary phase protection protein Dps n=1 Tax=Phototrophicus methaneseepsis TaxID=2710758 RepID=A0A7S8E862_9CHLR|nr:DNA starvation/stationary phase protection protein Dps [Phototrophicus methaneseepsis]QPC82165.1 DNA starvation/stationary phase protection protein Dps [Phototrophicus methaneseepsis]